MMTSPKLEEAGSQEPASKRQRLSPEISSSTMAPSLKSSEGAVDNMVIYTTNADVTNATSQGDKEASVGILRFVNEKDPGFSGILKQRYTDFLVNEVTLDGEVVHLTSVRPPKREQVKQTWNRATEAKLDDTSSSKTQEDDVTSNGAAVVADKLNESVPNVEATVAETADQAKVAAPKSAHVGGQEKAKKPEPFVLSDTDALLLDSYFDETTRHTIVKFYERITAQPNARAQTFGSIFTPPMSDRQLRGQMHANMRRIFNSVFETAVDDDSIIKISCASRKNIQGRGQSNNQNNGHGRAPQIGQPKGKLGWQELGGENLHFSLYKENKDTMEVVGFIGSRTRIPARNFSFAGTKDRRAVTVQRVSVYRVHAEDLARINRDLKNSQIGDFKYEKHKLELGDLAGNQFIITLRDCSFGEDSAFPLDQKIELANKIVGDAIKSIHENGFINYFGLQRFGSYNIGTDAIGKKILQGDFEGAVKGLLDYDPKYLDVKIDPHGGHNQSNLPRDDVLRAQAIKKWEDTGRMNDALYSMPKKFSGERAIIGHLGRRPGEWVNALLQINRNLRLMYVHAYQSLVWNLAASERLARFGNKVVKGDLVIIETKSSARAKAVDAEETDENGEVIVRPAADDSALATADMFERARSLTEEEVSSGKYTMFDIVLPTPGFDIEYPANEIGDFYKEFMSSERGGGLDPANMRRSHKDFSLSGSYRKVLAKLSNDATFEIKAYKDENEQMVETDLEKLHKANPQMVNRENHRAGDLNQGSDRGGRGGRQQNGRGRGHGGRQDFGRNGHHVKSEPTSEEAEAAELRKKQIAAWQNLSAQLKEDDRKGAAAADALKAARDNGSTTDLTSNLTYKETFIETEGEGGRRTGRIEHGVIPGNANSSTIKDETMTDAPPSANAPDVNDTPQPQGTKRSYPDDEAQDVTATEPTTESLPSKIAVVIQFQLGSSQYATMALRELMKQGGVKTYMPLFNGGR